MTPADVVRAVLTALEEQRWGDVARYVDPVLLERDYEEALEGARRQVAAPRMSADDFMRHEPGMPREVAEYHAERAGVNASDAPSGLQHIGVESVEQLAAMTPAQYLAAKLRAQFTADAAWFVVPPEARFYREQLDEAFAARRREVLGEIVNGDEALVVFRHDWRGHGGGMAHLAALRRDGERWVVQPGGELFNEGWAVSVGWAEGGAFQAPRPLAVRQAPWTSRAFDHQLPVELFPAVLERFRDAPSRAAAIALGTLPSLRTAKPGGRWSIQEHVGHLLDLEALGEQRLEDYRRRANVLAAADMTNRSTHEADHNATPIHDLTERLTQARAKLADALAALPAEILAHRALHPRLQRHMNVPEWVFFMCEHDDHHLARMREQAIDLEIERRATST